MIDLSNDRFLVDEDGNVTEEPLTMTMWHGDHPEIDKIIKERDWDLWSMMPLDVAALPPGMMYHVPPKRPSGGPAFIYASLASNPALIQLQKDVASYLAGHGTVFGLQQPENFHITLLYIENVDDDDLVKLLEAFNPPAQFKVRGVTLGTFEEAEDKPVVLKLAGTPPLMRLQRTLYERALSMDLNVSEYSKPSQYKPHITLALNMDPPDAEIIQMQRGLDLWVDTIVLGRDDYQTQRVIMLPALVGGQAYILRGGPKIPLPEPPSDRDYQNAVVRALSRLRDAVYKVVRGGEGSGHHGHEGRPGQVGGSAPGDEAPASAEAARATSDVRNLLGPDGIEAFNQTLRGEAEGVIEPKQIQSFKEVWIDSDGKLYPVPRDSSHPKMAEGALEYAMGGKDEVLRQRLQSFAEIIANSLGWMRLSGTSLGAGVSFHINAPPTDAQLSSAMTMLGKTELLNSFTWEAYTSYFETSGEDRGYVLTVSGGNMSVYGAGAEDLYKFLEKYHPQVARAFQGIVARFSLFVGRGGEGSGHHGHAGRPGEVGGSAPSIAGSLGTTKSAFRSLPEGDEAKPVKAGLALIDSVHHIPIPDGYEPIALAKGRPPAHQGELVTEVKGGKPRYLSVILDPAVEEWTDEIGIVHPGQDGNPWPELTTIHEFGHLMDKLLGAEQSDAGDVTYFWNSRYLFRGDASPELKALGDAIRNSDGVKTLMAAPETERLSLDSKRMLTTDGELFARSYAQWIATKTGDAAIRRELGTYSVSYGESAPVQWSDEDFAPIGTAMDSLFESKGLLK